MVQKKFALGAYNIDHPKVDLFFGQEKTFHLIEKHAKHIVDSWKKTPEFRHLSGTKKDQQARWFSSLATIILKKITKPQHYSARYTQDICVLAKEKGIGIKDLTEAILLLHRFTLTFLRANYSHDFNRIHDCFDTILPLIIQSYEEITSRNFHNQLAAINKSNILIKIDPRGRISYANEAYLKLSQYHLDELIWKHHSSIIHPDVPRKNIAQISRHIKAKKSWSGMLKNIKKDGRSFWVQSTIVPILDEAWDILEFLNINIDITSLKEAHKNIEEYRNALDESCLIVELALDGKVIRANHEFCIMTGYSQKRLKNMYFFPCPTETRDGLTFFNNTIIIDDLKTIGLIQKTLQKKKTWKGVLKTQTLHRGVIWCSSTIIPILDAHEHITEYIVVQTDVTDIEIAQMHLRNSYKKLQELNQKKDEFLNIASHELRTPMTSIRWYVSMILDGDGGEVAPVARKYLENVFQNSTRLLMLINEMLDISKIESWKQSLNITHHDIGLALKHITDELRAIFTHKKQNFILEIPKSPTILAVDSDKFKQILVNILGNANKFTPERGTIHVHLTQNKKQTTIAISDTGIGIEKKHFEMIFEKFSQVKNHLVRDVSGTGLGLPIAKSLTETMGGTISLKSQIGKWTTFYITFPTKRAQRKHTKKHRHKTSSRVLLRVREK